MATLPRLITLQAASSELGVPYSSLRDSVIRGELPSVRLTDQKGARILVKRADIERWVERLTEIGRVSSHGGDAGRTPKRAGG